MKIFLFDVPILILIGYLSARIYAKKLYDTHKDAYTILYLCFNLLFWLNILFSYFGIIQPWILGNKYSVVINNKFVGIIYVLSYPLWFSWGAERAWDFWGRNPYQGGISWFLGYKERQKPFKPSWKT
jgi:hypothetical protein